MIRLEGATINRNAIMSSDPRVDRRAEFRRRQWLCPSNWGVTCNPLGLAVALCVCAVASAADGSETLRFIVPRAGVVLIVAAVLAGVWLARRGRALPIRDIPGLLVFDEAVARATEMGRPTLFTGGGAADLKFIQTYASMPMLRRVAELSGALSNRLIVPVCYPDALPLHIAAVRDGYADAGAIEQFRSEDIRYFPGGQFFFAIASMGWMLEERPAACFYYGRCEADSLLFAETGQVINAMQIAGTDQLYQIPFFIAACDYTLIGEEFWATSAKLSQDPRLLGSLGAQDLFKLGVLTLIIAGAALSVIPGVANWVQWLRSVLE